MYELVVDVIAEVFDMIDVVFNYFINFFGFDFFSSFLLKILEFEFDF